jgi:hypothetical protein
MSDTLAHAENVLTTYVEKLTHEETKMLTVICLNNLTLPTVIEILRHHYDADDQDEISLALEQEELI